MNAFCLCRTLFVVTLLLMFHKTGLKDKKTEHEERKKDVPAATSAQQLLSGHDLTCASHPVMAL